MAWPKATDFIEAVQDLGVSVEDEELRGGEVVRTPLGLPMLWSGNFADVFKIHCPATGNTWALKCFTRQVPGLQDRYRRIATHLEQARLPFTVDFQYLEQGLCIRNERFPVLKMRWIEGLTLTEFVEEHLDRPQNLKMLLDLWVKLATRLRKAEMAHADLQHGNVILVPMSGGSLALRLIDYDGMYVPALAGTRSNEVGHPAYQHPQRLRDGTYNAEVDRFSHLAIYSGIRCLMLGRRQLWQQFNNGDNLLFREEDFRKPGESKLFRVLWKSLPDADARAVIGRVVLACGTRLEEAPLLDEVVTDGKVQPLTSQQEAAVNAVLSPPAKFPAESISDDGIPLEWLPLPAEERHAEQHPAALDESISELALTTAGLPRPPVSFRPAVGKSLLKGLVVAGRLLDGSLRLLRILLWSALAVVLVVAIWFATSSHWHKSSAPPIVQDPPAALAAEMKVKSARKKANETAQTTVMLFQTKVRPKSLARAEQSLAEGEQALKEDRQDLAEQLFCQAVTLFVQAQAKAPQCNRLGKAEAAWTAALAAADKDSLARYAATSLDEARRIAASAAQHSAAGNMIDATTSFEAALKLLKLAISESTTASERAETAIADVETAIAKGDRSAASDLLAKAESLAAGHQRIAALRKRVRDLLQAPLVVFQTGSISAVAFSPEGEHIVTGAPTGEIASWDAATGEKIRTLGNLRCRIRAISTDERKVLVTEEKKETNAYGVSVTHIATLIDVATAEKIHTFAPPAGQCSVRAVAISSDGRRAHRVSCDGCSLGHCNGQKNPHVSDDGSGWIGRLEPGQPLAAHWVKRLGRLR